MKIKLEEKKSWTIFLYIVKYTDTLVQNCIQTQIDEHRREYIGKRWKLRMRQRGDRTEKLRNKKTLKLKNTVVSSHRLLCAVRCVFGTTYSESRCNMYIRTKVCGIRARRRRCLTHSSQKITRNINNTALTLPNCHPLQKRPKTQFNVTKKRFETSTMVCICAWHFQQNQDNGIYCQEISIFCTEYCFLF